MGHSTILEALRSELRSTTMSTSEALRRTKPSYFDVSYGEFIYKNGNNDRGYFLVENGFFEQDEYIGVEVTWADGNYKTSQAPWVVGHATDVTFNDPYGVIMYGTLDEHIRRIVEIQVKPRVTASLLAKGQEMVLDTLMPTFEERMMHVTKFTGRGRNMSIRDWVYKVND